MFKNPLKVHWLSLGKISVMPHNIQYKLSILLTVSPNPSNLSFLGGFAFSNVVFPVTDQPGITGSHLCYHNILFSQLFGQNLDIFLG